MATIVADNVEFESFMAFSSYKTIGAVVKEFQTTYTEYNFILETPFNVNDYFREELQFVMREGVVSNSEYAICENLIYPVLRKVWKRYYSKFLWWSHESLTYDENLSGFPEYILAKLTKNITPYTIYELDKLFAAVNYIFQQCEVHLELFQAVA